MNRRCSSTHRRFGGTQILLRGDSRRAARVFKTWGKDLSGTLQGAGGVGGLLAVRTGEGSYYPAYDNNGNIVSYTDDSGAVVAFYAYDTFGNILSASGPLASAFAHRFSTKPRDPETGFYYFGYRFYAPLLGRWMNRDPIGELESDNLFCFALNHGIHAWDYLGLSSSDCKARNCSVGITTVRMLGDPNIDELYLDYLESIGYWESILTLADVAKLSITYLTVGTDKALNQLTQYLKAKATMSPSQITEIGKNLLSFYQRRGKRREHHVGNWYESACVYPFG